MRDDRWQTWGPLLLLGKDVHGATLGLVGFGRIGREMARRATGFGMRTLYYDRVRADAAVEAELARHATRRSRRSSRRLTSSACTPCSPTRPAASSTRPRSRA